MTFGEFIGVISNRSLKISIYDSYDRSIDQYMGYLCTTNKGSNVNNLFKDKEVECFDTGGFDEVMVALKMGDE